MGTGSDSVIWPAVLKYEGEDELVCIGSEAEWACDADLHACRYSRDDNLIDSSGRIYRLVADGEDIMLPAYSGNTISLPSFNTLLRAHVAAVGQCCSGKVMAASIEEGIALVQGLGEG